MNSTLINFISLQTDSQILESIIAPNLSGKIGDDERFVQVFLSVDSKGKLKGLYLKQKNFEIFTPYFALIRMLFLEKDVSELLEVSWTDIVSKIKDPDIDHPMFPLPLFMLRKVVGDYLGRPKSFLELKQTKASSIVCHCFGVTDKDIETIVEKKSKDYEFLNLQEDLMISSGCGSCLDFAKKIFMQSYAKAHAPIFLVDGHSLAFWCLKFDEIFGQNNIQAKVTGISDKKINISGLKDGDVDFIKNSVSDELFSFLQLA